MKRVELLTLNNILSEIKITGEGISRETRSAVMKIKFSLTSVATEFDARRAAIIKELEELPAESKEQQFRELLSLLLEEQVDITIDRISEEALDSLLDRNELKTSSVELLYTFITNKKWS